MVNSVAPPKTCWDPQASKCTRGSSKCNKHEAQPKGESPRQDEDGLPHIKT